MVSLSSQKKPNWDRKVQNQRSAYGVGKDKIAACPSWKQSFDREEKEARENGDIGDNGDSGD